MRILITGGAGFVGTSLCIFLKNTYPEYEIIAFDNLKRRGSELNLLDLKDNNIKFLHGDIRNIEDFEIIGDYDVLVEASAEPSVLAGLDSNPDYVVNNNFLGSLNCIKNCLKNNAKLIFLSTSRVYPFDKIENSNFIEEQDRYNFSEHQNETGISRLGVSEALNMQGARSFYGVTKYASELFIQEYIKFYQLQATITRFGVIAGPRQMGKTDQGVVTLWMAKHFWKQSLKYIGYGGLGKQVRDILHINDLMNLIDLQIHDFDKFNGKIYNAGGGLENSLSLRQMTELCENISGNKINVVGENSNRPADLKVFITDNTKIKNEIGWYPKKTSNDVFTDVYLWICKNESKLKNILS